MQTITHPTFHSMQPDLFHGMTPMLVPAQMRGYVVHLYDDRSDYSRRTIAPDVITAQKVALFGCASSDAIVNEVETQEDITTEMIATYNNYLHSLMDSAMLRHELGNALQAAA